MFKIGQRVELVVDYPHRAEAPADGIVLPLMGEVYTVRDVGDFEGEPILWLNEVINEKRFYLDAFSIMEQGFGQFRFKPVTSQCEGLRQ